MKLANKTALITGGGTGMGKVTALLFAREGANVIITGRREAKLKEVAEEAAKEGLELDYLVSDVSSEEDCKAAVDYAVGKYGRIDILFNNAGVLYPGITHETDTETWDKIFDTNVKGTYWMSKYTIPVMLENGGGSIVNNSSVGGLERVSGAGRLYGVQGGGNASDEDNGARVRGQGHKGERDMPGDDRNADGGGRIPGQGGRQGSGREFPSVPSSDREVRQARGGRAHGAFPLRRQRGVHDGEHDLDRRRVEREVTAPAGGRKNTGQATANRVVFKKKAPEEVPDEARQIRT